MMDYTARLQNLSNEKLIDVVKNYRQYGYDDHLRRSALLLLENRGITKEQLELTGNYENRNYDHACRSHKAFKRNSNIAFLLYLIILFNNILIPVVSRTSDTLSYFVLSANFLIVIGFFVYLVSSFLNRNEFYKSTNEDYRTEGALLYFLVGIPFYFLMFFYFRNQMKEKLKEIK